ncbi:hypothetical protein QUF72_11065 [Desulfobacterales bacterium HSG2]|nr:hypothetical protein [Desulfobacterales bacterium HSG2]
MPSFGPIKRKYLIRYLKRAGFQGPYVGGNHQFMIKDDITITLKVISAGIFYPEFYGWPKSAKMNGKSYRKSQEIIHCQG